MKKLLAAATLIVAAIGVLLVAGNDRAQATNSILSSFVSTYNPPSRLGTCTTCHTGTPTKSTLNAYGRALMNNGVNFKALEGIDSDGDRVLNLAEIKAGTFPGDAGSKPTPTTTSTTTTTKPAPASSTTTTTTAAATTAAATTATSTTKTAAPTPVAAATVQTAAAEGEKYGAGDAGYVWLAVQDGRLVVTKVDTTWDYSQETEDDEIEIEFRSGDSEIEFEAELEDGIISVKVSQDHEDGDDHESDDDHQRGDHDDDGRQDEDSHDGHDD